MVGAPSVAQVPEPIAGAALAGRVTNSSGEVLSGATVAIPALSRGTLTNRGGDFRLDGLPTGPVTVRVGRSA